MEIQSPEKKRYRNRDIDWLAFNSRVLQEAANEETPLYERLKFLAIFSSNLDEFFKVRVSRLRQIKKIDKALRRRLAFRPNKTLRKILKIVNDQQALFGKVFRKSVLPELAKYGIFLTPSIKFSRDQREFSKAFYEQNLRPDLSITSSENLNPLFFEDGRLYLVVSFKEVDVLEFIKVPVSKHPRFIEIPSPENEFHHTFLEDILKDNLSRIFSEGRKLKACYQIKVSRDAELYLDDSLEPELVIQIRNSLKQRKAGQPTRLLYDSKMPKALQKELRQLLQLGKVDMIPGGSFHNFSDFFGFPRPLADPALFYEDQPALPHPKLKKGEDFFSLIHANDQIAHYPYQSFETLLEWVRQATEDPEVTAINISLYRVARESALGKLLLKALSRGIRLTIFVEAKARFDEGNNIEWGREFQAHGAKVLYSFKEIKVHSKILLIQRKEQGKSVNYAYIGTGNFNEKTAKIYCDHGLFTADEEITSDLAKVFRFFEYPKEDVLFNKLIVSPFNSRTRFEELIDQEIQNAKLGLPAKITAKMNSLEDRKMIDKLYQASMAGVKIRLLVRGICCLIPGVEGMSENIRVSSIVDRYLEHGRIYLFHNKGEEIMFMGSADWMLRNIEKRIEVLTPLLDRRIFTELKDILMLQMEDNVKARTIGDDRLTQIEETDSNHKITLRSQYEIYDYLTGV
ncbi:polyphosphate kinase 1 [Poritiphilus flavus]|uniref:Polyphosphate kinase n=1 Tax=Poritiphilus flavus TaxID=2697053 RepID=A0A6L9E776_9FLAO|nr:polyphosphate kinase 1 [Poritiphilus flavus]NAS10576.1 polyphosphate kinase 1 [Poritiphilus flavus]